MASRAAGDWNGWDGAAGEADSFEIRVEPRLLRPARPGARLARPFRVPWLRASLASAAIVGALAVLAPPPDGAPSLDPQPFEPQTLPPSPAPLAPPPAWLPLAQAPPLYGLDAPELKGLALQAEIHRASAGDGRRDRMTFGVFGDEAPHFHMAVQRGAGGGASSFYVDLVRQAAGAGLAVVRSAQPVPLATKFGMGEAAETLLAGDGERACLAFRVQPAELALGLAGWLCGRPGAAADSRALTCLLDRLTLTGGRDDPPLKVLFAQAERRRDAACTPAPRPVLAGRR